MAFHIGGESLIDRITEESFRISAAQAGLGEKMAMKYFARMCGGFERALEEAAYDLSQMGFGGAQEIREKILHTGGIRCVQKGY